MPAPKRTPGKYCAQLKVWTPYMPNNPSSKGHSSCEFSNPSMPKEAAELVQLLVMRSKFSAAEQEKINLLLAQLRAPTDKKEAG